MLDVVLVTENQKCMEKLNDKLYYLNKNIKEVCKIDNVIKLKKLILSKNIDVVLIDFNIYYSLKIKDYMYIKEKVKNIIIVNFNNNEITVNSNNIYKSISEDDMFLEIVREIVKDNNLIDENKLGKQIEKKMFSISYDNKYKGTKYLIDAIIIAKTTGNCDLEKIEKTIYSKVAQKYNVSIHNVKCNIINATNNMYYLCEEERLKKFLEVDKIYKPGPKIIIEKILSRI